MIPNGFFTIKSVSGEHKTLKVWTVKTGKLEGYRMIGLLTGPDNERDYTAFGFVYEDLVTIFNKYKKMTSGVFRADFSTGWNPSWGAWEGLAYVFINCLSKKKADWMVTDNYSIETSKRCLVCNRRLTNPESLERGIGPECLAKT